MRRTALLSLSAVLGLGLAITRSAGAECAMPSPAMSPESVALPPNPVIYRFEPSYRLDTFLRIERPDGTFVGHTSDHRGGTSPIRVREIRVEATSGTFIVRGEDFEPPRTYTIGGFEKPTAPPVVASVSWIDEAWTCSHSTGIVVEARGKGVVAFRVEWPGYLDYIIPSHDSYFWMGAMGGEIDPSALRAFLGHPNCVADLIPSEHIGRKDFRLFAKYADGSELEVEVPRKATQPQPQPETQPQPQPQATTATRPSPWRLGVATAVSIAALISLSTLFAARRRRRNGMMVP